MTKEELRQEVRRRKMRYTAEELRKRSHYATESLLSHPRVSAAHTVMLYASLPDEVYTHDLLLQLWQEGKRMLLPEVVGDTAMQLRVYEGPASLREGRFHILEPQGSVSPADEAIDVALVPGMAFDRSGHRLGRGKGYYDRFLQSVHTYKIGMCFDFQLMEHLPHGTHDVMMDEVNVCPT